MAAADAAPLPPIAGGIGRPSASSPAPAAAAGPRKAGAGGGVGARGSPGGARQQLPKGVSLEKMYDDGNKLYRESVLRGDDLRGDDLKVQIKVRPLSIGFRKDMTHDGRACACRPRLVRRKWSGEGSRLLWARNEACVARKLSSTSLEQSIAWMPSL